MKKYELAMFSAGALLLSSLPLIFLTQNFTLWGIAKGLYFLGLLFMTLEIASSRHK